VGAVHSIIRGRRCAFNRCPLCPRKRTSLRTGQRRDTAAVWPL